MSRRRVLVLPLLLVGALVACSGDDDSASDTTTAAVVTTAAPTTSGADATTAVETTETTTSTDSTTDGSDQFCQRMRSLADLPEPDLTGSWEALQQQVEEGAPEALRRYDEAIDIAPDEVRDDLRVVRDFSVEVFDAIAAADSLEDLGASIANQPADVVQASSDIENFVQDRCGFGVLTND
jgi:hypothetical protein